jgi:hypothetical protein
VGVANVKNKGVGILLGSSALVVDGVTGRATLEAIICTKHSGVDTNVNFRRICLPLGD